MNGTYNYMQTSFKRELSTALKLNNIYSLPCVESKRNQRSLKSKAKMHKNCNLRVY